MKQQRSSTTTTYLALPILCQLLFLGSSFPTVPQYAVVLASSRIPPPLQDKDGRPCCLPLLLSSSSSSSSSTSSSDTATNGDAANHLGYGIDADKVGFAWFVCWFLGVASRWLLFLTLTPHRTPSFSGRTRPT